MTFSAFFDGCTISNRKMGIEFGGLKKQTFLQGKLILLIANAVAKVIAGEIQEYTARAKSGNIEPRRKAFLIAAKKDGGDTKRIPKHKKF